MEEKIKLLKKKLIKELIKLEDGIHIKLDYDPIIIENLLLKIRVVYIRCLQVIFLEKF